MERPVPSVVIKLPPGFRFHPTDEELVVQYLRRKVFSCPFPSSIIPEIDLGKFNPWDLPHNPWDVQGGCESESERYFFALRENKYLKGDRSNRATGLGYWKSTGRDRAIVAAKYSNLVVGMKKSLVFYKGKAPKGERTDWIMHEYRLSSSLKLSHSACRHPPRDFVLCRIFKKKRAEQENHSGPGPASPSVSESSCITKDEDECSNGEDYASS